MHRSFRKRLIIAKCEAPSAKLDQSTFNKDKISFFADDWSFEKLEKIKYRFVYLYFCICVSMLKIRIFPGWAGGWYESLGYSEVAGTSVDRKIRQLNSISYKINLSELVLDGVKSSFWLHWPDSETLPNVHRIQGSGTFTKGIA